MIQETHARSVVKAVSWRLGGTALTVLIAFLFTGRLTVSIAIGCMEVASKIGLFYIHERLWERIRFGKRAITPAVVWFTGLPESGKTTLARGLADALAARGLKVELVDGDKLRAILPRTGFSKEERDSHVRRAGVLASTLERHGIVVVASLVSPYRESREFVRGLCRTFLEIHVTTPLGVCERRDSKGLYARARRGEIAHFTGVSDPYEPPVAPDLAIDTSVMAVEEAVTQVVRLVERRIG